MDPVDVDVDIAVVTLYKAVPAHTVHLIRQLLAANTMPPLHRRRVLVVGCSAGTPPLVG